VVLLFCLKTTRSNLPISCEIGTLAQIESRSTMKYTASMVQNPSASAKAKQALIRCLFCFFEEKVRQISLSVYRAMTHGPKLSF